MSKKCSVENCQWDAHPLYYHPRYGNLCENHFVDLAWLVMYCGDRKLPEYPEPGREHEANPYYLANSMYERITIEEELDDYSLQLVELGFKLKDIPTSERDRIYLLNLCS